MKVSKQGTSWIRVVFVAAVAFLAIGCFGDNIKDSEELIGAYDARYEFGTEQLQKTGMEHTFRLFESTVIPP